jgi:glycosyltransferase involved in cell wall biosynthesis
MLFSIVTPCFNSLTTLPDTLESVKRQDFTDWEHIVVDGASKDGTVDLLKSHSHLKWISEKDQGHFHAMNKGIARASGDWVVILNADDCFRPGALRQVADAIAQHPDWEALFGDVVFVDNRGNKIYQRQEAVYDFNVLLYGVDYICHQAMFVRKSVYDRLGDYRYKEFTSSTDLEYKLRLGRAGCVVGHVPAFLVNFRYHDAGFSSDRRVLRNSLEEAIRIRREYGNPGGWRGRCLQPVFKAKRQFQKLFLRGTCDLVPGTWRLKSHLKDKTAVSSNAGLDKL